MTTMRKPTVGVRLIVSATIAAVSAAGSAGVLSAACGVAYDAADAEPIPDTGLDGAGGTTRCADGTPFGQPRLLSELNTSALESHPRLSTDELTILFASRRTPPDDDGGGPVTRVYVATRTSREAAFGAVSAVPLEVDGSAGPVGDPMLDEDDLEIVFTAFRSNTAGDIFHSTRASPGQSYAPGTPIAALNTDGDERAPYLVGTGNEVWFTRKATTESTYQIMRSVRLAGAFQPAVVVPGLDTGSEGSSIAVSDDGLSIYFTSYRPGGVGSADIWFARRDSLGAPFGAATNIAELNGGGLDLPGWISRDGCRLYFYRSPDDRVEGFDLYVAEKPAR